MQFLAGVRRSKFIIDIWKNILLPKAGLSRQSQHANPGVRLTVLYGRAKPGKRLMSSA
jgi:hypothetical protein